MSIHVRGKVTRYGVLAEMRKRVQSSSNENDRFLIIIISESKSDCTTQVDMSCMLIVGIVQALGDQNSVAAA